MERGRDLLRALIRCQALRPRQVPNGYCQRSNYSKCAPSLVPFKAKHFRWLQRFHQKVFGVPSPGQIRCIRVLLQPIPPRTILKRQRIQPVKQDQHLEVIDDKCVPPLRQAEQYLCNTFPFQGQSELTHSHLFYHNNTKYLLRFHLWNRSLFVSFN